MEVHLFPPWLWLAMSAALGVSVTLNVGLILRAHQVAEIRGDVLKTVHSLCDALARRIEEETTTRVAVIAEMNITREQLLSSVLSRIEAVEREAGIKPPPKRPTTRSPG